MAIQISEVRAIDWMARQDAGWNRGKHGAGIREGFSVGLVQGDDLVAAGGVGNDFEWAADLVRQFGDAVELSAALDLDADED